MIISLYSALVISCLEHCVQTGAPWYMEDFDKLEYAKQKNIKGPEKNMYEGKLRQLCFSLKLKGRHLTAILNHSTGHYREHSQTLLKSAQEDETYGQGLQKKKKRAFNHKTSSCTNRAIKN